MGIATAGGLKAQAKNILVAADASLVAAATASQSDSTITTFV